VQAGGKTTHELEQAISGRLREGYLVDPKVSVQVIVFRPFYILGEVNQPGEYPSAAGLTVLNAIAIAGGFSYRANRHKVYIRRSNEAKERAYRLTAETRVMPGDTIRIPERFF
jgi:polysaccharide export outer membrane protein